MFSFRKSPVMPTAASALPGRPKPIPTSDRHFISDRPLQEPYPEGMAVACFGLGCFWGAERVFWQLGGVWVTAVGYTAGFTPNATYEEVCSGSSGHNEVVRVVFDPVVISYGQLLKVFFESHDPTQGMRQGNDVGTQYRSGIYTTSAAHAAEATEVKVAYNGVLTAKRFGAITTEILPASEFYFAEAYHQQYLAKNPGGYCNIGGVGLSCPVGTGVKVAT
jgi:peptide-methionine (S)-S-oxide reductase